MEKLQILNEIKSGLRPTHVDLSNCNLQEFPLELLDAADCLESLNLGGNQLCTLPQEFSCFQKLRVLFFASNRFEYIPEVLGVLSSLFMLSFKSNRLRTVSPMSLSPSVGWLILTDNRIEVLPASIGTLLGLRKLMLSGNRLSSLPHELMQCRELELVRLACNDLAELPLWLLNLPKLAWLAFAGNDRLISVAREAEYTEISWSDVTLGEKLGEGASGTVYLADLATSSGKVAVKLFKGEKTSDGSPVDEMKVCEAVGLHPNFVSPLGRLTGMPPDMPSLGLVLPLIPVDCSVLAGTPSFSSVTRDCYTPDSIFSKELTVRTLYGISSACAHLHAKGITHGDLYAHNILLNKRDASYVYLTDFGASSVYDVTSPAAGLIQAVEVRAWGCLAEEMLSRTENYAELCSAGSFDHLNAVVARCLGEEVSKRPRFRDITTSLAETASFLSIDLIFND